MDGPLAARILKASRPQSLAAAHYRKATNPNVSCGRCAYFLKGKCSMFSASVDSDYTCDEFASHK